jgi:hypothetical protein
MKWTMMLATNRLQINLEPENDHEREAMKILKAHEGVATVHAGVSISDCRGGYLRSYEAPADTVAITITKGES